MAALGAVIMLTGGLMAVMTYAAPLIAGVLLMIVKRETATRWAWAVWLVTALLSMVLCADKEAALFYIFFGWYPVVKSRLDRLPSRPMRLAAKAAVFAAGTACLYGLIGLLFPVDLGLEELAAAGKAVMALFFAGLLAVLLFYDALLVRLAQVYEKRLRPQLRFLR